MFRTDSVRESSVPYVIVGGYINNFWFWQVHKDLPWLSLLSEEVLKTLSTLTSWTCPIFLVPYKHFPGRCHTTAACHGILSFSLDSPFLSTWPLNGVCVFSSKWKSELLHWPKILPHFTFILRHFWIVCVLLCLFCLLVFLLEQTFC